MLSCGPTAQLVFVFRWVIGVCIQELLLLGSCGVYSTGGCGCIVVSVYLMGLRVRCCITRTQTVFMVALLVT